MNITKNQIDDLNATIKIELGKEDYAGRVEKALKDYQKKVVIRSIRSSLPFLRLPSRKNSDGNCEKNVRKIFIGR